MWKCKHCKQEFEFETTTQKGNHTRWCDKNSKRNDWYKFKSSENQFGKRVNFNVSCFSCNKEFIVKERSKLFPKKEKYFCSRSCANSIGGKAKSSKYHYDEVANYTTICWRYHERMISRLRM